MEISLDKEEHECEREAMCGVQGMIGVQIGGTELRNRRILNLEQDARMIALQGAEENLTWGAGGAENKTHKGKSE